MANVGDVGNVGDAGNVGAVALASGVQSYPDRIDLPFVSAAQMTKDPLTDEWKEPGPPVSDIRIPAAWLRRNWGAEWWAWLVLDEFDEKSQWRATLGVKAWNDGMTAPQAAAFLKGELDKLVEAAHDERPDALGEILAQHAHYADFVGYFAALLRISPRTHGATFRLLHIGGLLGIPLSMRFKVEHNRPRPSQICPALMPPVEVPGHPAYPSGHATQAMLMALCVEAALPGDDPPEKDRKAALGTLLKTLAWRIARNREIAGLHYPSDTLAGFKLAEDAFALLNDAAKVPRFDQTLKRARQEWKKEDGEP